MPFYKIVLKRALYSEITLFAPDDDAAQMKAWSAAIRLMELQPETDSLGDVKVESIKEVTPC